MKGIEHERPDGEKANPPRFDRSALELALPATVPWQPFGDGVLRRFTVW
jgi:hypothetical protein